MIETILVAFFVSGIMIGASEEYPEPKVKEPPKKVAVVSERTGKVLYYTTKQ